MAVLLDLSEKFGNLKEATFLQRKNRFVGECLLNGKIITCHIADTGRLKEILVKGRKILISLNPPHLKTDSKLIAAKMKEGFILLNTSIHSLIGEAAIKQGILGFIPKSLKKEVTIGKSRIDFLVDGSHYVELKGCNLRKDEICLFPDAPTKRGKKHLEELIRLKEKGFCTYILLMILRDAKFFKPNEQTDPQFAETFYMALDKGVEFKAFKVKIENGKIILNGTVKLLY
ncbi:DNA/RNA nuclease SfsA [Desulfurobacterium indicum]|uniref:Sugar fermentation stimulation protein homolog n=1 Tax=Desulfurobacterium indicum TaxID=1914305 RepID=A0A1R1MMS8_9BACT|nr:DNA/RNA nuclease SfsA [Desulfurobacterium indicum]OMH41128.1 sugar fermentation stimulation protein SfsA [Desulfurobacterium indicum]